MSEKKIVVISDTHLGYEHCDKNALNDFLDDLNEERSLTDLILLGDIVDMWRRDASGVFLENQDIIAKIISLKEKVNIFYIAGNHDYHVINLANRRDMPYINYPFIFRNKYDFPDGNFTYRFMHGHEFEWGKKKDNQTMYLIFESMCRAMSDTQGHFEDMVWGEFTKFLGDFEYFLKLLTKKKFVIENATKLMATPDDRFGSGMTNVDRNASNEREAGISIVVYGHTHRAYINRAENIVNCGSWVTDAKSKYHNTYVEISGGKPKLFEYGKGEVTDRVDFP